MLNALETPFTEFDSVIGSYESDQFFASIVQLMDSKEIEDPVQNNQIANLMPVFRRGGGRLLYEGKLCISSYLVATVLPIAHSAKNCGHFGFSKTLGRLQMYHWRHNIRDVKKDVR